MSEMNEKDRAARDDEPRRIYVDGLGFEAINVAYLLEAPEVQALIRDANAAQAMVVEQAAQLAEDGLLSVDGGLAAQEIRALADTDGLALVQALRAEARESAMQALASMGQAQEAYEAQLKAEADRDRLAAANAALEAQVARLMGAAKPFTKKPVLADNRSLVLAVDRLRAALAEVQALRKDWRDGMDDLDYLKDKVMTLEAYGGLWVTAEDYAEAQAKLARLVGALREIEAAPRHAKLADHDLVDHMAGVARAVLAEVQAPGAEPEPPKDMRGQTALEMIRKYQTALEKIAEPASVSAPDAEYKSKVWWKKLYKGWRGIAAKRIDIARKALEGRT